MPLRTARPLASPCLSFRRPSHPKNRPPDQEKDQAPRFLEDGIRRRLKGMKDANRQHGAPGDVVHNPQQQQSRHINKENHHVIDKCNSRVVQETVDQKLLDGTQQVLLEAHNHKPSVASRSARRFTSSRSSRTRHREQPGRAERRPLLGPLQVKADRDKRIADSASGQGVQACGAGCSRNLRTPSPSSVSSP